MIYLLPETPIVMNCETRIQKRQGETTNLINVVHGDVTQSLKCFFRTFLHYLVNYNIYTSCTCIEVRTKAPG